MIKKFLLTAALLAGFGTSFAQTKPEDVKTFTLANGMKFLVLEDKSIPNANMYLFWKVGSRNEVHGITGLSHFFEHMMFNGSKNFGPKEFDRFMEANGGSNNAYTTENVTVYTDWFQKDALEPIFKLESDRIASLSIDPKMVESERGVVLSERSTGLENSNYRLIGELVQSVAFQEHPYMFPVIGFESDIKSWTQEDLENYFKTYYSPNNATVVVVGDVTLEQVKKMADQYMAPIPARGLPPKIRTVEPQQNGERRVTAYKDIAAPNILMAYHIPETKHEDFYALDLLSSLLTSGNSSRLTKSLVMDSTLAMNVSSVTDQSFDPSLFLIYAIANSNVSAPDLEKAISIQIDMIIKDGVKGEELQKVKNQKLMEFYRTLETINGKANSLGSYDVFFGDYKKMFEAPELYKKVTVDDIKRVAAKYFTERNRTVGYLLPEKSK
ncbi:MULTISPECIES: pitrilysin family protein [Dyadobacter]|jgi:zinc protease|uniref:Insulinase family protein n=1 Tax=Dyadobacter chenhuakuii TaxID=2909339 RepID=A0A9X1TUZ1_9BACT|nr:MULTISPECIES: pitrilysin family protein [Dyadobacter]MCF2493764.1 insulinase family protein [Dyadobacter chenhuakuii]MCF2500725.1 insulinase family protein [Dyadobacter chenhuakuii]MCF2518009.1 insulinase family protein [Dyadobacter sp. CY351]USJ30898.1 insulinase family protein [Dyadobacter chenhuakuii]